MVVLVGDTVAEPMRLTMPMPGSMVTLLASDTFQVSVEETPAMMETGLHLNEFMVGGLAGLPALAEMVMLVLTSLDHASLLSCT